MYYFGISNSLCHEKSDYGGFCGIRRCIFKNCKQIKFKYKCILELQFKYL